MPSIEQVEQDKYQRVWESDGYRNQSPSEQFVMMNRELVRDFFRGHEVAEYGSGTGRGSRRLHDMGYTVTMVDHCDNALDEDVRALLGDRLVFSHQNLWLMEGIETDHFVCVDVMEHIPPEKVDATLAAIARQSRDVGVFDISLLPDNFGKLLIGEPLHLSIFPYDTWLRLISAHFDIVGYRMGRNNQSIFVLARPAGKAS